MVKILLVAFILVGISGGLIYFRFFAINKADQVSPASQEFSQTPQESVEVPKTLPEAPIEDNVKALDDTVKTLVTEVNLLKSSTVFQNFDLRLKAVETAIVDLKVRITSLEKGTTQTTTQTTTISSPPLYIPLGSSGSTSSQAWINMDTYQITLNPGDYSGYKNMQLEINFRRNQPGNSVYARLYNSTDSTATSSEISTTSTSFVWMSSSGFTLPAGAKTYVLQLKVPDGTEAFIQNARIKVNY